MIQPTPEERESSWLLEVAEGIYSYSQANPQSEVIRAFSEIKSLNLGKPSTVSEWEVFIACRIVHKIREETRQELLKELGDKKDELFGVKLNVKH